MAWEKPSSDRPVWCAVGDEKSGVPTAQSVYCVTKEPGAGGVQVASFAQIEIFERSDSKAALAALPMLVKYEKFTSQDELGHFLLDHYKIRTPKDLTSCEVCHR